MSANCTVAQLKALTDFGYNVGLAFQIIDDILDITQTSERLGKTAGKDTQAQKGDLSDHRRDGKIEEERPASSPIALLRVENFHGKAVALEALAMYLLQRTGD